MASPLATYAFLNAKLKARTAALLDGERIGEMVRAKSLPEAMLQLRGTRFESLEASLAATGDLRACEASLYADEARVFLELVRWSREPVRSFFLALTLRFEVDRLKDILRLWFDGVVRGGDPVGHAGYADRVPLVNALDLDAMLVAADAGEMADALAGTPYARLVAAGLPEAVERGNLFELELELDKFYFSSAYAAAAALAPRDRVIAERALDMDADAQNADRLNRYMAWYGMDGERAAACLLPYGSAAGALPGNAVCCLGLDMEDSQGDKEVITYLKTMGARVDLGEGDIRVEAGTLRGCELDLNATPDALPMMAALACFAEGTTRLVNVPQARLKETDRISVMREELAKLGAHISELEDGLVIEGGVLRGGVVEGHDDHRVVMALAIAATAIHEPVTIRGAEAIEVTYPEFTKHLTQLGGRVAVHDLP